MSFSVSILRCLTRGSINQHIPRPVCVAQRQESACGQSTDSYVAAGNRRTDGQEQYERRGKTAPHVRGRLFRLHDVWDVVMDSRAAVNDRNISSARACSLSIPLSQQSLSIITMSNQHGVSTHRPCNHRKPLQRCHDATASNPGKGYLTHPAAYGCSSQPGRNRRLSSWNSCTSHIPQTRYFSCASLKNCLNCSFLAFTPGSPRPMER